MSQGSGLELVVDRKEVARHSARAERAVGVGQEVSRGRVFN